MGKLCLTAVPCDNHCIIPVVGSLARCEVIHIRIFAYNIRSISGINNCHSLVSGNHIVNDVITCVNRVHGISLVNQPLVSFLNLILICSIHGISKSLQCYHKGIPLRIIHVNISFIFRITQKIPAIFQISLIYYCLIIKDSYCSPEIRTGITVARIIALVHDIIQQIFLIRNFFPVKCLQIFFFDQSLNHVIRRDQHIISLTA